MIRKTLGKSRLLNSWLADARPLTSFTKKPQTLTQANREPKPHTRIGSLFSVLLIPAVCPQVLCDRQNSQCTSNPLLVLKNLGFGFYGVFLVQVDLYKDNKANQIHPLESLWFPVLASYGFIINIHISYYHADDRDVKVTECLCCWVLCASTNVTRMSHVLQTNGIAERRGGKSGETCASLFPNVHVIVSTILLGEKIFERIFFFSTTVVEFSLKIKPSLEDWEKMRTLWQETQFLFKMMQ